MKYSEIEHREDSELVYVHGAIVSVLATLLEASVAWVWILGHRPNRYVQWWESRVPLNTTGSIFTGEVRDITLDLQMPTEEFVSRATEFDDHGLVLIQSRQRMPDTLCLERIPEHQQNEVLKENNATLRMYLPHATETAQVQSFRRGYLSTVIGR